MAKVTQVKIDQEYRAFSRLLTQPFIGRVIKKGEHSAIVKVEKSSPEDTLRVNDLGGILVVAYKDLLNKVNE